MDGQAGDLLPLASPLIDYVHQRYLQRFVEQDVVGHMEMDLGESERGAVIYRDGDYFGRDVNLAARVVARARGGEVLLTGAVRALTGAVRVTAERLDHLHLEDVGQVKLKGFSEPHFLSRANQAESEADR